ncbi:MAG: PD-(D/E)XK nuclease family protein [Chloroflexi bacterium]|nr:PD-(D/E)XK nuclease family protein [Chloroflexota bacterium]
MPLTWSVSRDQILHDCERRYYFQYLANAKINSRDSILREIAFLKKLKNIPGWKGDAFHSIVAGYFRRVRQGQFPTVTELVTELQDNMMNEWAFSSNKLFRTNPRAIDQDGGLALFEHEYEENPEFEVVPIIDSVAIWLYRFMAWVDDVDLVGSLARASRIWLEEPVYGPNAPGFKFSGAQVLVKVDLALQSPDGNFDIFDWKTGTPFSSNWGQFDSAEFQVNVYQLWPHLAFGHSLDSIRAHLLYVVADPVRQQNFGIDENVREQTLSFIRRSIDRVKQFAGLLGQEKLCLEDCDFALSMGKCRWCKFKRLCQRMTSDE